MDDALRLYVKHGPGNFAAHTFDSTRFKHLCAEDMLETLARVFSGDLKGKHIGRFMDLVHDRRVMLQDVRASGVPAEAQSSLALSIKGGEMDDMYANGMWQGFLRKTIEDSRPAFTPASPPDDGRVHEDDDICVDCPTCASPLTVMDDLTGDQPVSPSTAGSPEKGKRKRKRSGSGDATEASQVPADIIDAFHIKAQRWVHAFRICQDSGLQPDCPLPGCPHVSCLLGTKAAAIFCAPRYMGGVSADNVHSWLHELGFAVFFLPCCSDIMAFVQWIAGSKLTCTEWLCLRFTAPLQRMERRSKRTGIIAVIAKREGKASKRAARYQNTSHACPAEARIPGGQTNCPMFTVTAAAERMPTNPKELVKYSPRHADEHDNQAGDDAKHKLKRKRATHKEKRTEQKKRDASQRWLKRAQLFCVPSAVYAHILRTYYAGPPDTAVLDLMPGVCSSAAALMQLNMCFPETQWPSYWFGCDMSAPASSDAEHIAEHAVENLTRMAEHVFETLDPDKIGEIRLPGDFLLDDLPERASTMAGKKRRRHSNDHHVSSDAQCAEPRRKSKRSAFVDDEAVDDESSMEESSSDLSEGL
jgi:hypothetical protein